MNKDQALNRLRSLSGANLSWWDHPMAEGDFETGCWTPEGNSIALTIDSTHELHGRMTGIFEISYEHSLQIRQHAMQLIQPAIQDINNASDPEDRITLTPAITRDVENWLIRMFSYWKHDKWLEKSIEEAKKNGY